MLYSMISIDFDITIHLPFSFYPRFMARWLVCFIDVLKDKWDSIKMYHQCIDGFGIPLQYNM